jgi:hypothetical protein
MDPIVFEEHSYEENEIENTVVYHACAVTLAVEKPLEEEETVLEDVLLMSTITFDKAIAICLVILQTRTHILSKYR